MWKLLRRTCVAGCAASPLLAAGGCPDGALLGGLAGVDEAVSEALSTDAVSKLLDELVDGDPADLTQAAADEPPIFGEDAQAYSEVGFDAIDEPVDEPLPEVLDPNGDPAPPHGGLAGRFINDIPGEDSDTSGGVFRGRWFAANREVIGYIRGTYDPIPAELLPPGIRGGGVFRGKYIDLDGRFRGFLHGRYGRNAEGEGVFVGRWHDRYRRLLGVMRGRWADDPNSDGGEFAGRWTAIPICDETQRFMGGGESEDMLPDEADVDLDALEAELEALDAAGLLDAEAFEDDYDRVPLDGESDLQNGNGPCLNVGHGLVRGWHKPGVPDPNAHPLADGVFRGQWRNAAENRHGSIRGLYVRREFPGGGTNPFDGATSQRRFGGDEQPGQPGELSGDDASGAGPADGMGRPRHPRVRGWLIGRVTNADGEVIGRLRGAYGVSRHGLGVFRARVVGVNGVARGVMRGRWDDAPGVEGGPFFGAWVGARLEFDGDPNDPTLVTDSSSP